MESSIKNLETDLANNKLPQSDDDKFQETMSVSFFLFTSFLLY